jgi:hypothetical protein
LQGKKIGQAKVLQVLRCTIAKNARAEEILQGVRCKGGSVEDATGID